jgi:hypothetical protein
MDAKTLEALKASIAKWERSAEAKTPAGYKTGQKDCPLCVLFFWKDAWKAYANWDLFPKSSKRRDRAHAAARDEVTFLKSLLPEETP